MAERKYIDLRITAISDEDLKDFLIALRKIQWCGDVGASRTIPLHIDGDGSGSIDVDVFDESSEGGFKNLRDMVNLDENKMKKVSDGEDFETQWIGE